ncbi:hypothetical protein [Acinetobacter sp. B51(2017)]|uniref:hypothetical protein n=1 Tax=Acinetobacter sp. B51(2017) TaxID=2060938 RepID=UPI000F0927E6|nr:hypothetical protein [Acinetobacter sp. B51(2017)]
MITDVKVQFFSHLNGLNLGNNWGDLIRLLDAALVNGLSLPSISTASIDDQGDVHLTFNADHKALLFQVVELTGFLPESLNQKYRIKGVPNNTQLILKPANVLPDTPILNNGAAKLASLGYEIIFRDVNDVKRVYRAKNPTAQHPFIRVDETISGLNGNYSDTYAKYAMVGLLEHMTHIDDYANPNVLQLPFDPSDPAKNWKITGTGTAVVRGWSHWYYARNGDSFALKENAATPLNGARYFTIIGDQDAFYFLNSLTADTNGYDRKIIYGLGLFKSSINNSVVPNWFLATTLHQFSANQSFDLSANSPFNGSLPFSLSANHCDFFTTRYTPAEKINNHILAKPILPDYQSGFSNKFPQNSGFSALQIPFYDELGFLRGTLKHICYSGKSIVSNKTTPQNADFSMAVLDSVLTGSAGRKGCFAFYLGELE